MTAAQGGPPCSEQHLDPALRLTAPPAAIAQPCLAGRPTNNACRHPGGRQTLAISINITEGGRRRAPTRLLCVLAGTECTLEMLWLFDPWGSREKLGLFFMDTGVDSTAS